MRVWGEEGKDYNCTANECRPNATCGHYTQLVWNTTRAVGCGVAYCRQNSPFGEQFPNWTFYVCNYTPPGTSPRSIRACPRGLSPLLHALMAAGCPGNVVGLRPFNATNCPSNVTSTIAPSTTTRDAHRRPCVL